MLAIEDYQQIYSFLPYFEELAMNRENPSKNPEPFVIRQEMMHTEYSEEMQKFTETVYATGFIDRDYTQTLDDYGVKNDENIEKHLSTADKKLLRAILTRMLRTERFVSGAWIGYEEQGLFVKALERLGVQYGFSS